MNYKSHFFLKRFSFLLWVLFLLLLSGFQNAIADPIAVVIAAKGEVYAMNAKGEKRALQKDSTIELGNTIVTKEGTVQLRFTDDGLITFDENTEFKVADYQFSNKVDGTEKVSFQFLKGAFRTIVGKIGKERYEVKTNFATIGTRGTEYSASLGKNLKVDVHQGKVLLKNKAGILTIAAGLSASVKDELAMPELLSFTPGNVGFSSSSSSSDSSSSPLFTKKVLALMTLAFVALIIFGAFHL